MRQEEDWRPKGDAERRGDALDRLKYIPLGGHSYLTLGGQTRQFYESIGHENWGASPAAHNDYLLQRYMLHADYHLSPTLRVFSELKSGVVDGRIGGARPADRDDADINQLFVELALPARSGRGAPPLALRLGRQELDFGAGRQIAVREGPNVRVGFDGAFGVWRAGAWRVDTFSAYAVQTKIHAFDDGTDKSQTLSGLYATGATSARPSAPHLDVYLLQQKRRAATYDQGTGRERRETLGFRVWNKARAFDYDIEPSVQGGKFADKTVRAWSVSSEVGYTFPHSPQKLRLGLSGGLDSGDRNPNDGKLETFSPPAASGRYFGQIPSIGPQNATGFSPSLRLNPTPKTTLTLSDYFFYRTSTRDGLYAVPGFLLKPGGQSRARFIGSQPEINLLFRLDRRSSITVDYAQFITGRYLQETPPGQNIQYLGAWFTFVF